MPRFIILNGFMGAGKSRIAPHLAARLNWPWFDTDKMIEQRATSSIEDIFARNGEAVFRQMERDLFRELLEAPRPAVIAIGGGLLLDPENHKLAQTRSLTVYVQSAPEAILQRVKHSDRRPLLRVARDAHFENSLLQRIRELLATREAVYLSADIIVQRDGLEAETVAAYIYDQCIRHPLFDATMGDMQG